MELKQRAAKPVRTQHSFVGNEICVIGSPEASVGPLAAGLEACQFEIPELNCMEDEIPREWRRRADEWISHQLADCAGRSRRAIFVMVYESPATFLLRRICGLADGMSPPEDLERFVKQSLDHWSACHLALLEQYREYEGQAVLVSGDRSIETGALLSRIQQRFDARDLHARDHVNTTESAAINPHWEACVQVIDSLAPECLELYAEFESCAELMGRDPEFDFTSPQERQAQTRDVLHLLVQQVRFEQILARYGMNSVDFAARLESIHKGLQESTAVAEERMRKLTVAQEEASRYREERNEATKRYQQLSNKTAGTESEKKALQAENELLLLQLHQVQEEVERYYLLHKNAEQQLDELQKRLEAPPASLWQRFGKSVADRFDALPLRAVRAWFGEFGKRRRLLKRHAQVIRQSGDFNEEWYLQQYPDVAQAGCDPVDHYLSFGATEARNPSRQFDTRWYLESNPDVAAANMNPLLHYIEFGKSERRRPTR